MSDPEDKGASPDVMQAIPMAPMPQGGEPGEQEESITQPAKLLRIASMVRELLEQTRQASLDEPGRKRLAELRDALRPQHRDAEAGGVRGQVAADRRPHPDAAVDQRAGVRRAPRERGREPDRPDGDRGHRPADGAG